MRPELFEQLLQYDRKSTDSLKQVIAAFSSNPDYPNALIEFSASEHAQVACGATWLLKAFCEAGGDLSPEQAQELISNVEHITNWDAQLHICQTVGKLTIPEEGADILYAWLEPLTDHDRPFVRAWSLDALCQLALQHRKYLQKANSALQHAADDAAASVRARVRNLQNVVLN